MVLHNRIRKMVLNVKRKDRCNMQEYPWLIAIYKGENRFLVVPKD